MVDRRPHWLTRVPEVMLGIGVDSGSEALPLAFLLGAGASHSSGGPRTADILEECRQKRPNVFPDDDAVYEKFSDLTPRERDRIIRPLFEEVTPYVGYRCLAAMAKARPVFVLNLNWDNCVGSAAAKVGVPFARFDLKNKAKGKVLIDEAIERGHGIVCAHVHGYLDAADLPEGDEDEDTLHGIRFARPDTSSFDAREMQLLEELLASPMIVVGTSFVGSPDAHQMLQALLPTGSEGAKAAPGKTSHVVEPLWVFERGVPAQAPGFGSRIAVALSNAMLARDSIDNFVRDTNVDFDLLLTALRAEEVGLPWPEGGPSKTRLPLLEELVPPDPRAVRPLLDDECSLIVGAPYVGSSTLAYLLAWWRCLVEARDGGPRRVLGLQGPGQALDALQQGELGADSIGAIVIDDVFDERGGAVEAQSVRERLAKALGELGDRRVYATASPDAALNSACGLEGSMRDIFATPTVVAARKLWRPGELRAWAKSRGGERAEAVCREIRMGLITTPSQAVRTMDRHVPHEQQPDWRERLRRHLDHVYEPRQRRSLALAMLRLQDFGIPRSAKLLSKLSGEVAQQELIGDPWGLCMPIEVDGEDYLRLASTGVVRVVDDWLDVGQEALEKDLRATGVRGNWTVEALRRWRIFRETDACAIPEDFGAEELELFGSEYVKRALEESTPDAAVEALWRIWESNRDHWTAKEVALDLVLNWELVQDCARARLLRDALLKTKKAMGAYAFFEAILRVGRPVPVEIWAPTTARLFDLARITRKSESARRQIALTFDAVLWRRCPVSQEQERKLVEQLLVAHQKDERLAAAMAAACAYHWHGARRLEDAGYELPVLGTELGIPQAREIAWLVAWHFAHQSRCRALASRRAFLSTMDLADESEPRYLDRATRQNPLDADHRVAVVRCIEALLRHTETAGWALHLIMNIHTTTGTFRVPDEHIARLHRALSPKQPGRGVLSAALTYMPNDQIHQLLLGILSTPEGSLALQEGLRRGVEIEGTEITEPRFSMGSDPWAIRRRWGAMPTELPFGATVPQELIGGLAARIDSAVNEDKVDREKAERAIAIMSRGHTHAAETWRKKAPGDDADYLPLLTFVADYYSRPDDEW